MSALHRHTETEPAAASRFALAWERLAAEDEARREWLDRAARNPDSDEIDLTRICPICSDEFGGDMRHTVCDACRVKGYVSTPCRRCGGPAKRHDFTDARNPERRGCCVKCRAEIAPKSTPQERLALANAARGRGRPRTKKTAAWQVERDVVKARRLLRQRGYQIQEAA